MRPWIQNSILTLAGAVMVAGALWFVYSEYRREQFLESLCLVGCSTSMIHTPSPHQEQEALERSRQLEIDLFSAYTGHPGVRDDLAWLLITTDSSKYFEHAKANVASVPWWEVRVWRARYRDESLPERTRDQIFELLKTSPTSEAKLFMGRWHTKNGQVADSEDAYFAAMTNGEFWDALDAADELLKSERYRPKAEGHLLSVVQDAHHFTERAAGSLIRLHPSPDDLTALLKACARERPGGPNRLKLVAELTRRMQKPRP